MNMDLKKGAGHGAGIGGNLANEKRDTPGLRWPFMYGHQRSGDFWENKWIEVVVRGIFRDLTSF